MSWQPGKNKAGIDKYYIQNGAFTICKIGVKPSYELWHKAERLGEFTSGELAKQAHLELTEGELK